jgi:hypothetical protein
MTFGEITSGNLYNEISALEHAFAAAVDHAATAKLDFPDVGIPELNEIRELVNELKKEIAKDPDMDPHDASVLCQRTRDFHYLLYQTIIGSDSLIHEEEVEFEGGPGMSSTYLILFSSDPDAFQEKIEQWTEKLSTWVDRT